MNQLTNTGGFTGFKPGADRQLLADVHRWARTNGWNWHECWGWVNARYASEATLGVDWDESGVTVRAGEVLLRPTTYPVASVRQAVDLLVTLDILPTRFSSAARAVLATFRALADELETEAAVHDKTAGSMFLDAGFRIRLVADGEYTPEVAR